MVNDQNAKMGLKQMVGNAKTRGNGMKVLCLTSAQVWMSCAVFLMFCFLSFGYGYFFGRYEQIQINRSLLQPIPDVNCGSN
jgi:hypothetical protein